MRIIVKGDDTNIDLIFPTPMICSGFGLKLISKHCDLDQCGLTSAQLRSMAKKLKSFRKKHKGWVLLEAESDEYKVIIKL
ncbi:MAG: hypothetical protein K2N36_08060 [Ruminiclostridium sp.]|nr:hypothetical protein [Ruminiclostridium sp.]